MVGKARDLGAIDAIVVDAREEFASDYVLPAIKANALYGGGYPLFTALGRPLIGKLAVEHARASGCDTIAHGCTGKGNDQVRLEATVATLDPELESSPRSADWRMGREEEVAYAREHGIPVKGGTEAPPYSIDDNLWGRSSEGGAIEDLVGAAARRRLQPRRLAPRTRRTSRELVRVGLRARTPTSLDGERARDSSSCSSEPRSSAAATASGSSTTSRTGSSVSRSATSTRCRPRRSSSRRTRTSRGSSRRSTRTTFKRVLEGRWADLCYAGLWWEPLRSDLDAFMESANEYVTGEVTMKLYKGSATPVARSSPYALYDQALAGFGESGGEFSQAASPGFIELFTLQSRMAHRLRARKPPMG